MTAVLVADPNPVASGGTSVDIDGTGFEVRPTRLLVDGATVLSSFLPEGGAFSTTITASTTSTTQHIVAEQCQSGSFVQVATTTLTIEDAPPGDTPFADITGWRLVFADEFDRTIAEGDFLDGANFAPPGASFAKTADGRYGVYKDGWTDTTKHGRYDPSIASVDGSKLRIHIQTRDGYPRVFAMTVLPSGGTAKGGVLGARVHVKLRSDALPDYKVVPLLWADASLTNDDLMLYGEIDWPEGETVDSPHGFMHRTGASTLSDQYVAIPSPDTVDLNDWHDYVVEWVAGTSCKFFLDGVQVGVTQTSRVPYTLMHWVLQFETQTGGAPIPSPLTEGFIEVDRVAMWVPA